MPMNLHHVNISATDVEALRRFYVDSLGLTDISDSMASQQIRDQYPGRVAWLEGESGQVHLAELDPTLLFRTQQAVNPVLHGHIAFRTRDIDSVRRRLDATEVPYSDYGKWAMKGWHQMFLYDPAGNVIEIHQAD
jgi:catechol 2,3-dioxygenase-like lactoylglutathione lyase family enzyme